MSEQNPGPTTLERPTGDHVPVHPVLWIMLAVMVGFELAFWAVDAGRLPQWMGRGHAYAYLAFVDRLFDHALGVRALDFPARFWETLRPHTLLTHAFLHGGWLHLALNGAAFLGLGHALVRAVGVWSFLTIFVVTAVAGALTFGLIADTRGVMVGASGVVFGMLAVITAWQERALRHAGLSRMPIWRRIGALVLLNVLLSLGLGGLLAWEAHLGGWVAGWLLALVIRPRSGPFSRVAGPGGRGAWHPAGPADEPRPWQQQPPRS